MEYKRKTYQFIALIAVFLGLSWVTQLGHIWPTVDYNYKEDVFTENEGSIRIKSAGYEVPSGVHFHKYTQDYSECVTPVVVTTEDKGNTASTGGQPISFNRSYIPCSPAIFRDYFQSKNRFYSDGTWVIPDAEVPETASFYPETCFFDESHLKPEKFSQCLERKKINKILVLGDSNGHFFHKQLLEYFQNRSDRCTQVRKQEDGAFWDPEPYFSIPGVPMFQKLRGCWACTCQVHECWELDNGKSHKESPLSIEYIGISSVIDSKMRIYPKGASLLEEKLLEEDTVPEFLLQKYFPHQGFPDIIFHFSPFHHEAGVTSLTELQSNITDLARLFVKYLPPTTSVVFLDNIRTCPARSGWPEVQRFIGRRRLIKNELMHYMNQVLFDVLKPQITRPGGNLHGFLDFGDLTCPVTCIWHRDGAHMAAGWYTRMVHYLFAYLCAE